MHFLTSVVNQSSDNYWTRFLVNIFSSRLELKTSPPAFIFAKCGHWSNHSFLFQVLVISWIYALCRKKLHFNRIEFQTNNNVNWLGDKIWQTENSKEKKPKRTFRFALPKNSKLCLLWDCGCSSACSSFLLSVRWYFAHIFPYCYSLLQLNFFLFLFRIKVFRWNRKFPIDFDSFFCGFTHFRTENQSKSNRKDKYMLVFYSSMKSLHTQRSK